MEPNIYTGRQGTQFATVLGGAESPDLVAAGGLARQKSKAKATSDAQKALRGIKPPEYWYKHDKEIQADYDDFFQKAAAQVANGIDPFTAVDDASQEVQRAYQRVMAKANTSNQLKDNYEKQRNLVNANPDKFSGFDKIGSFLDQTSLSDFMDNSLEVPTLDRAIENPDLNAFYTDMVSEMNKRSGESIVPEQDLRDQLKFRLQNPDDAEQLGFSYSERFKNMPADEMTALKKRANLYSNGDLLSQAMYEDAQLFNKQKPFTIEKLLSDVSKDLKVKTDQIEKGAITTTVADVPDKAIKERIKAKLLSDPRASSLANPNATSVDDQVDDLFNQYKSAIKAQVSGRKFGRSEDENANIGPFSPDQASGNFKDWYRQLKKGYQQAADYIIGYKLPGEDVTITKTEITPDKKLRIYLKGNDIDAIKKLAQKAGKDEQDYVSQLLSDDADMQTIEPSLQETIGEITQKFGMGSYMADEGAVIREYDLNSIDDQEWMKDPHQSALKRKKLMYETIDENKVKPHIRRNKFIPGLNSPASSTSGAFIPQN